MMGLVAHPSTISSLAVSCDGRYLFSAGGPDLCVNMWAVDTSQLPSGASADPVDSYLCLLEGGEGGELHNDIVDYFYYCQLRHLGEDPAASRIEAALNKVLAGREKTTRDLGGKASTTEFTDAVIAAL